MIIYSTFINDKMVTEEGCKTLLKKFDIKCIVDLIYNETAINSYSSYHEIFSEVEHKFSFQDKLPADFNNMQKEEKNHYFFPSLFRLLDNLMDFMSENAESNILILYHSKALLEKSVIYIIRSIRNLKSCDLDEIFFLKLNFPLKLAYSFCKHSYMNGSDCWNEKFSCNYSDISCELMDEVFEDLAINYGMEEEDFFVDFEKIKAYRSKIYEQIIKEKREENSEQFYDEDNESQGCGYSSCDNCDNYGCSLNRYN